VPIEPDQEVRGDGGEVEEDEEQDQVTRARQPDHRHHEQGHPRPETPALRRRPPLVLEVERQVGGAVGEHERADAGRQEGVEGAETVEREVEPQIQGRCPRRVHAPATRQPAEQACHESGEGAGDSGPGKSPSAWRLHRRASMGAADDDVRPIPRGPDLSAGPVLCAFDASEPSLLAMHAAAWLAGAMRAPLDLVYVVDHGALPALPRHGATADPVVRGTMRDVQGRMAEDAARAEVEAALAVLPHADVTGGVLTGQPAPVIRQRAVDRGAGLLVSGTAARQGLDHLLQGSVAGALAAEAPCPVVVVPPDAALREPGPVLVGNDDSEHARRAVRYAEALATRLDRGVVDVHVDDGDPVEELARAAREQRACLAVTGTRGLGPLRGQLLGSVSTGLVRAAGRPVVLVSEHAGEPG
jgi:nucleotide-binding universal stress UspA family protein